MSPFDNLKEYFLQVKNLTAVGISNIIANSISGIFWIYLASLLGVEGYGELGYLLAIMGTIGSLASFGTINTLIVYVSKGEKIQATIFFIVLVSATIIGIISYFVFQNAAIAIYPLGYVIFSSVLFDLLGRKSFVNYGKYMIIQRIIMVSLALLLYQQYGINGIVLGYSLSFFPFIFLMYRGFKESKIDFSILRGKTVFITNNYVTHVLKIIYLNIDKLMIFPLFGTMMLGPYQLGFQIFSIAMLLPNIVLQYTLPHDAIGTKNIKLKKIALIVCIIITVLAISTAPIIIPEIFPQFKESVQVVQIMSLALIPSSLSVLYSSELLGSERSKIVLFGAVIGITVIVIGIFTLGKDYGLVGLTASFVIAKIAEFLFLHIKK
jgi:O-antigen/teichoic acid export membrane protein